MAQQQRPRKVSFSDTLPSGISLGLSMSSMSTSSTSRITTTSPSKSRSLPRSPAPLKQALPTTPPDFTPPRTSRPYVRSPYVPTHVRGESASSIDVFGESPPGWNASTPPRFNRVLSGEGDKENLGESVSRSPGSSVMGSPSPQPRRSALPRLDFSRTGTPLTSRKLFTPRPLGTPSKVGKKPSQQALSVSFATSNTRNESQSDVSRGTEGDMDAVELALNLASLAVSGDSGSPSPSPRRLASLSKPFLGDDEDNVFLESNTPVSLRNPNRSVEHSPPSLIPSGPCTPSAAPSGYASDDSDGWVPRPKSRPAASRRVLLSDDEDSTKFRSRPVGLRGRIPDSIRRLNNLRDEESEDESPISGRKYLDLEAEDEDSDESEEAYEEANDTFGSLKDFIVNDDGNVSEGDTSDCESEESYEDGAVSEGSLRDEWRERSRPRASQVFKPGRYDLSSDSIGSLRKYIEGDDGGLRDDESYVPSSPSSRSKSSRSTGALITKSVPTQVPVEVIEIMDSENDDSIVCIDGAGEMDGDSDEAVIIMDGAGGGMLHFSPSPPRSSISMSPIIPVDNDDGLLHYSPPRRPVQLPDLGKLTLFDSDSDDAEMPKPTPKTTPKMPKTPRSRVPSKNASKTELSKAAWGKVREEIARETFEGLDKDVFGNGLGKNGAGATIAWRPHLRTTAGMARRRTLKGADDVKTVTYSIELSDKVISTKEQIKATLAHEMCHLAQWALSKEAGTAHGRVFKHWAAKVMRARPDIEVTTKHSYEIQYKYQWKCTNDACGTVYGRHSKSIDINRQACGRCKSRLTPCFETKEASGFQVFLKENMKAAKAAMPGSSHGDVMQALSKRWGEEPEGDHVAYFRAMSESSH